MRSINKVILIGNLTRDPELRQTPNGQNVVTFGLATNREWVTRDGRKQNSAEFHELVAWARLADICSEHLKKGKLVYIEGYLKTRSWDATDGTKKFRTEIVVQDMIMLDKKNKDDNEYIPEGDYSSETETTNEDTDKTPVEKEPEATQEEQPSEQAQEQEQEQEQKPEPEEQKEIPMEGPETSDTTNEPKQETPVQPSEQPTTPAAQPDKVDIDSDLGL